MHSSRRGWGGHAVDVDPPHDNRYEGEQIVVGEHVGGPEGVQIVLSAPGAEPPFDQGDDVGVPRQGRGRHGRPPHEVGGPSHGLRDRPLIGRPGPVVARFSGSFGRRGAGPVEVRVGQEADLVLQSQVLQQVGAGAVEGAVGIGFLPEAGGEGGHEHWVQLLDRDHAQQAPDVRGHRPHPHPPGDGGGQREQILVVQVIGGQENILRPLGIAPAQPPPQHAHGTAAAHWEDVGPLRLPHETADLLHRTPNHSHAAPLFGDLFTRRRDPVFSPPSKRLVAHSEYAVRGRFRVAQRLVRRGQPS